MWKKNKTKEERGRKKWKLNRGANTHESVDSIKVTHMKHALRYVLIMEKTEGKSYMHK